MVSSIFLSGRSLSWAPYIDGSFSSESEQCIRIMTMSSLAVPLSKTQDRRPVSRVMRSMLKEPALSLQAPDLKITSPLAFSCQHQSPRNSSGIEPMITWAWTGCHCVAKNNAAVINFFIGFFLFLNRTAHFGAVVEEMPHANAERLAISSAVLKNNRLSLFLRRALSVYSSAFLKNGPRYSKLYSKCSWASRVKPMGTGASIPLRLLTVCMTKLVVCVFAAVLLLTHALPAQSTEPASADDTARFLAGLRPSPVSPLNALTKSAVWQAHAARFNAVFELKDTASLSKIRVFAIKEIPQSERPLLYFFSGPDFLYANAFFADATTYVLSGLEPAGEVPRIEELNPRALEYTLRNTERSLGSILSLSFFQTNDMRRQLSAGPVFGTLPLLYVFLARAGKTISEVEMIILDQEGNVKQADEESKSGETEKASQDGVRGIRIAFSDKGHSRQTLYYFSGDVSNDGLRKSGLLKFCRNLGQSNAFIKSASYLLHRDRYADLRDFILKQSKLVLQDDSGIPLSYFDPSKWQLQPFGNYVGPIPLFRNRYQASLARLFRVRDRKGIDFGVGYQWRRNTSNLLLATKKVPIL
jgi:hypothetical protein